MRKLLIGLLFHISLVAFSQGYVRSYGNNSLLLNSSNPFVSKEYRLTKASNQRINLPHGSDIDFEHTDAFSLVAYVKWPSSDVGNQVYLMTKVDPTNVNGWDVVKESDEKLRFVLRAFPGKFYGVKGDMVMSADQWHLVAITWDGTKSTANKFYVDGILQTLSVTNADILTTQTIKNTSVVAIGSRAYATTVASSIKVGAVGIWNRVLDVNEIPNGIWNYGVPKLFNFISSGCVRAHDFTLDAYSSGSYNVKATIGVDGTTTNMAGTELVNINSVEVPIPKNVVATPGYNTITLIWSASGVSGYNVEASDNGSTGWVNVATEITKTIFTYNVGTSSTLKYFRVKARTNGIESGYSSTVSATTFSSPYTNTYYVNTRKLGDNSYSYALSVETLRVAPGGYYDATTNRTYFVFMSRAEVGYDMVPYVYYFDHATNTLSDVNYVGLKDRSGLDRHPIPAIMVTADGYLLVAATHFHNEPFQIWKSTAPNDPTQFRRVGELGIKADYPEFRKMTNGDIYCFGRVYDANSSTAALGYFKTTDNGNTWGSLVEVVKYTQSSLGRPYPTLSIQPNTIDRIHICLDIRDDDVSQPHPDGYWKQMGYLYSDDGLTWKSGGGVFSKQVVSAGFITMTEWINNFVFTNSVGTINAGLAVSVVTPSGQAFISHYKDDGSYNMFYHNGSSWVTQPLTFPDVAPDYFTFGYQAIQAIRHISGTTFDIYCTKSGVVKRYRTTDTFVTLVLQDANVLPVIGSYLYERGTTTHNIYEAPEPFLFYSIKISDPTPTQTSPGAWSDIIIKKI